MKPKKKNNFQGRQFRPQNQQQQQQGFPQQQFPQQNFQRSSAQQITNTQNWPAFNQVSILITNETSDNDKLILLAARDKCTASSSADTKLLQLSLLQCCATRFFGKRSHSTSCYWWCSKSIPDGHSDASCQPASKRRKSVSRKSSTKKSVPRKPKQRKSESRTSPAEKL